MIVSLAILWVWMGDVPKRLIAKEEGEGEVEKKKNSEACPWSRGALPKIQGNWVRGRARPNYLTP